MKKIKQTITFELTSKDKKGIRADLKILKKQCPPFYEQFVILKRLFNLSGNTIDLTVEECQALIKELEKISFSDKYSSYYGKWCFDSLDYLWNIVGDSWYPEECRF